MGATTTYIDKDTVRSLSQRSDLWGAWLTLHAVGTIILAGALFIVWPNILTFLLAVMLIGSRQHGMSVLMHDAAHRALFKSRALNDFVGQYILALPFGNDMHAYRKYHLKHHKYAQRPNDPDLGLSEKFPVSRASMARKLLRDISGWTGIRLRIAQVMMYRKVRENSRESGMEKGSDVFGLGSLWPAVIANGIIFAALALSGVWWAYFAFWLLPMFTWFQLVLRIRNIAEHALTTKDDNPLTHARTTKTNWLTRVFLAPYWVNYHVEHHAYMYVPCYRLKALHKDMLVRGHGTRMDIKPGYAAVLKLATTG